MFSSFEQYDQCFEPIRQNAPTNDEITDCGFTIEPPMVVQAPRIAECAINLECCLEWHRPLYEASRWHLFAGRVVHLGMDESAMAIDPAERMHNLGLMYNVRGTVNPLTGDQYVYNTLGLLDKVVKVFGDDRDLRTAVDDDAF